MSVLSLRGVGIAFDGLRALDDVTVDVPSGGVTALIGPNGAGKTTLLNCISGLYRHEGEVLLDGRPLGSTTPDRRALQGISRTFQTPALLDDLPAVDNVMLGLHGRASRREEARTRDAATELLDRFGLVDRAGVLAGDLPHGDRRRVETVRALISRPQLLLLDEPAAGLDDGEAVELLRLCAEHAGTCLLVEHNMHLVMTTAAHVVVLVSGRLLATGNPAEVSRDPRVVEAYLGDGVL